MPELRRQHGQRARDDRGARTHRLETDERIALEPRGDRNQRRATHQCGDSPRVHVPDELHASAHTARCGARRERLALGPVTGEHEVAIDLRRREGVDEDVEALLPREAAHPEDVGPRALERGFGHGHLAVYAIRARGFLQHMVRIIAGTLMRVGTDRLSVSDVAGLIAARDRRLVPPTAPGRGLFLVRVEYPDTAGAIAASPAPVLSYFDSQS